MEEISHPSMNIEPTAHHQVLYMIAGVFAGISIGTLGGWIVMENNLTHDHDHPTNSSERGVLWWMLLITWIISAIIAMLLFAYGYRLHSKIKKN